MGEISKLDWLIWLFKRAIWDDSFYFLYLPLLSISKILASSHVINMFLKHKCYKLMLCICVHGLGLLHLISTSWFDLSFRSVHALSQFCCTYSCYLPLAHPDLWYLYSFSYTDVGCPVINGPKRVDVSHPLFWGQKQIQFLKWCVL
jgi:ribose/xylose/arabinose/galactoside ABC-type transport system permease subunit